MRRLGGHGPDSPWVLWIVACTPLLFAAVSLPMVLDWVAPNPFYGIRTAATFASEEAWYRVNRASGIAGVVAGLIGCAVNWRVARSSAEPQRKVMICVAVLLAVTAAMIVPALLAA